MATIQENPTDSAASCESFPDYEWRVTVRAKDKDFLDLALIERLFGGKSNAPVEFREWLNEKGIPSEFFAINDLKILIQAICICLPFFVYHSLTSIE
jgi:hypothetical protein